MKIGNLKLVTILTILIALPMTVMLMKMAFEVGKVLAVGLSWALALALVVGIGYFLLRKTKQW